MKMVHSTSTTMVFHSCLLVLTCLSFWTGAVLSLEDQSLQQLRDSHNQFQKIMEAKVSHLESLKQEQNKIREDSEAKIAQLEAKVQQQELLLAALLNIEQSTGPKSVPESNAATRAMPTSCADLKNTGHIWNGVFSVIGASTVETVYCDFTKPVSDSGFQTFIGYSGVQSKPTYFHGQAAEGWALTGTPIPYNFVLNVGGAYDRTTKKFTAPVKGRYFFFFSGVVESFKPEFYLDVALIKNGVTIAGAGADDGSGTETLSLQSTLSLIAGDQVWTEITKINNACRLAVFVTHFTGFLLEEDITLSLKVIV